MADWTEFCGLGANQTMSQFPAYHLDTECGVTFACAILDVFVTVAATVAVLSVGVEAFCRDASLTAATGAIAYRLRWCAMFSAYAIAFLPDGWIVHALLRLAQPSPVEMLSTLSRLLSASGVVMVLYLNTNRQTRHVWRGRLIFGIYLLVREAVHSYKIWISLDIIAVHANENRFAFSVTAVARLPFHVFIVVEGLQTCSAHGMAYFSRRNAVAQASQAGLDMNSPLLHENKQPSDVDTIETSVQSQAENSSGHEAAQPDANLSSDSTQRLSKVWALIASGDESRSRVRFCYLGFFFVFVSAVSDVLASLWQGSFVNAAVNLDSDMPFQLMVATLLTCNKFVASCVLRMIWWYTGEVVTQHIENSAIANGKRISAQDNPKAEEIFAAIRGGHDPLFFVLHDGLPRILSSTLIVCVCVIWTGVLNWGLFLLGLFTLPAALPIKCWETFFANRSGEAYRQRKDEALSQLIGTNAPPAEAWKETMKTAKHQLYYQCVASSVSGALMTCSVLLFIALGRSYQQDSDAFRATFFQVSFLIQTAVASLIDLLNYVPRVAEYAGKIDLVLVAAIQNVHVK